MSTEKSSSVMFRGIINGFSREDFDQLTALYESIDEKEKIFISEAYWGDAGGGYIVLNFSLKQDESYSLRDLEKKIFPKIADFISEGQYGLLLYVGQKVNDIAYVFFGHKRYAWRRLKFNFPEWWGEGKSETSEWDKLFEF